MQKKKLKKNYTIHVHDKTSSHGKRNHDKYKFKVLMCIRHGQKAVVNGTSIFRFIKTFLCHRYTAVTIIKVVILSHIFTLTTRIINCWKPLDGETGLLGLFLHIDFFIKINLVVII